MMNLKANVPYKWGYGFLTLAVVRVSCGNADGVLPQLQGFEEKL